MQSLFLAAIADVRERGGKAIEAFGYRYAEGESIEQRFLIHRTVFPSDFLADFSSEPCGASAASSWRAWSSGSRPGREKAPADSFGACAKLWSQSRRLCLGAHRITSAKDRPSGPVRPGDPISQFEDHSGAGPAAFDPAGS